MAYKAEVKTTFRPAKTIQPIYTGGPVGLSANGRILATCLGEDALLTDLDTGVLLARIEGDGEPITTLSLSPDCRFLVLCSRSLSMRIFNLDTSEDGVTFRLSRTLKPHSAPVVTSTFDPSSTLLATGGADGVVKVWDVRGGFATHTLHGHSGIVTALLIFQVDLPMIRPTPSGRKRGSKQIQDDAVTSQDHTTGYRLASGGEDGKVRIWDLHKRKSIAILDSHVSVVRDLDYSIDQRILISGSRDKTVVIWESDTWQQRSTVPVLEVVEAVGFVNNGRQFFVGGENGRLRIWNILLGTELTEPQSVGVETEAIVQIIHQPHLSFLLSVHADQVLVLHSLAPLASISQDQTPPLPIIRRISGTHDEIIDVAYVGRRREMLALATNLEDIRLISIDESSHTYFGADVSLLKGHTDIVVTIATDWSGHWLVTGAKDNTARLWRLDPAEKSYTCYAIFTGHAESVGAVSLPNSTPPIDSAAYDRPLEHVPAFVITGSTDKTIKKWEVPTHGKSARAKWTRKAHDKDINAIATSYANTAPLFASASQDRTVKIWDVETGEAIAVLRGHKRGVWSVAFSPSTVAPLTTSSEGGGASGSRGMVLTGSGDKTVRIWSLTDYSCIRTFEGHANSILKVVWLPSGERSKNHHRHGPQVASAAGDGLVKIWDAQGGGCAATLDNHTDRVWALAVKRDVALTPEECRLREGRIDGVEEAEPAPTTLISGSADSTLTFWLDATSTSAEEATTRANARVEQDQELQNHIRASNYREAIVLALQLDHPRRLLDLFSAIVDGEREKGSLTGQGEVDEVLAQLSDSQLWSLMRRCRDWNTNARTSHVAQRVLWSLLHIQPRERLLNLRSRKKVPPSADSNGDQINGDLAGVLATLTTQEKTSHKESVKDVVDALRAYTERHHQRLEKMGEERFVLAWALQMMDGSLTGTTQEITMTNGT